MDDIKGPFTPRFSSLDRTWMFVFIEKNKEVLIPTDELEVTTKRRTLFHFFSRWLLKE